MVRATPLVARVRVLFAPPMSAPSVPPIVNSAEGVNELVATLAKVFTPEKYGMFPVTAAEDVERPTKLRAFAERLSGNDTVNGFS